MNNLQENAEKFEIKTPDILPVLPLRDIVVFPFFVIPLSVGRSGSVEAVNEALATNRFLLLTTQKNSEVDEAKPDDMFSVGTVAVIIKMLKMPDGTLRLLVQGLHRARIKSLNDGNPFYKAVVEKLLDPPVKRDMKLEALTANVVQQLEKAAGLGKTIPPEVMSIIASIEEPGKLADFVANHLTLKVPEAQELLEVTDPLQRLKRVNEHLVKEITLLEIQKEINLEARDEIDKSQREYFLRQQLKAILQELGESDDLEQEILDYRDKLRSIPLGEEAKKEVERQMKRLARMHGDSAEASVVRTYLDWMIELPWGIFTTDLRGWERLHWAVP